MKFINVKSRIFLPPKDEIWDELDRLKLRNGDILVITSKILAIHQGNCVKINSRQAKRQLVKSQAEGWVETKVNKHKFLLTIKNNILGMAAGIDESNANGFCILLPKNPQLILKKIHGYLTKKYKIRNLGLITTDSHTIPMHRGMVGVALGFYGFEGLLDYRGKPDLFGRKLRFTQTNIIDSLAGLAVYLMGEGSEQAPFLIIRGANVKFVDKDRSRSVLLKPNKDLYRPLYKVFNKR